MKKKKVLFLCVQNSARSQMAVEALREAGIDISGKTPRRVFDVWKSGQVFAYVVTVCTEAERKARACPIFPSATINMSWPFPDPSSFEGNHEARLEQTRQVRDALKARIETWCAETARRKRLLVSPDRNSL